MGFCVADWYAGRGFGRSTALVTNFRDEMNICTHLFSAQQCPDASKALLNISRISYAN